MWKFRRKIFNYLPFFSGIMLLAISFVGVVYGIIPAISSISTSWNQLQILSPEVASLKKRAVFIQSLDEATLLQNIQNLGSAVPADASVGLAFIGLETVARESGVTITEESVSGPGKTATDAASSTSKIDPATGSLLLPIKLSIQGSYDQIKTFVGKITNVRRLYRTNDISVTYITAKDTAIATDSALPVTGSQVTADMVVDTFYLPIKAPTQTNTALVPMTEAENALLLQVSNLPWASQSVDTGTSTLNGVKPNPFAR